MTDYKNGLMGIHQLNLEIVIIFQHRLQQYSLEPFSYFFS